MGETGRHLRKQTGSHPITWRSRKPPARGWLYNKTRLVEPSPCGWLPAFPSSSLSFICILACLLLILSGCASLFSGVSGNNATPTIISNYTPTIVTNAVSPTPMSDSDYAQALVQHMTLDEKLGQMVIVEFYGSTLNSDLIQMIQGNHISGVLIENKNGNAQTRPQLVSLISGMQGQARLPLFVTTDYEGGVVNELRRITGERPSEAQIGATHDPNVAYQAGLHAAQDLTGLGLNVNFMPIVDVLTNPNNPGLPDRTFGSDPTLVTNMGRAYLKGLTDGGVVGCLKHFPGLGSASIDPHYSLPHMDRSLATLNAVDFVPYRTMIDEGIVPMVMVTHILNPQLDPNLPTSLSPNVVTGILRDQMHFNGVIISDTLWMGGISNTYNLAQAAVLAVKAGTDLLLGPRGLQDTVMMLTGLKQSVTSGQISMAQIDASVQRILEMKLHYKILTRAKAQQLLGTAVSMGGKECVGGCAMVGSVPATRDSEESKRVLF
ncbi:MAG TPA: glycoside hydrolase family 3 N-terminal domain-containing protein [Ktedonobacteraceae bacterium]|nr:glycoside hydrolase family 3 N-terminal domain-containing protein [Ktedonobacteraceae bacterium]